MCVKAVELLYPLIGARGLTPDSHFLRCYRDIQAATMQINLSWDRHAASSAELLLGMQPSDPRV